MSNRDIILVLTDAFDEHANVVIPKLDLSGKRHFRLNLVVSSLQLTKILFDGLSWTVIQNGLRLQSEHVGAVWCRRATVSVTSEHEDDHSNGFRIWKSEWNRVLYGLYAS